MGIHIPQTLLNVSEEIKVKVKVSRLTDRQLKNVAKQVKAGFIPLYANSATAHIARHLVKAYDIPCIKWSSWRLQTHNLSDDHPIYEAMEKAVAMSKIEKQDPSKWWADDIDKAMALAKQKGNLYVSMYMFTPTGEKILKDACKGGSIPADNPVHQYLDDLLNRRIEHIDMESSL